jgi:FkbM family methyltransferase
MSVLSTLSRNRSLRRLLIPMFARINVGDVTITHQWTGDRMKLHSFKHKGYWFHGRSRERSAMLCLVRLVGSNDIVFDVGGHIGYTALLFASLGRQVHVFEPGSNNLPYLHSNLDCKPNVVVVPSAVGAIAGSGLLMVEGLTGQNNTLLPSAESFRSTSRDAFVRARTHWEEVAVTTLDEYSKEVAPPDVIKIDVEGFEFEVLQGAAAILRKQRPLLMVEVSRNNVEIAELMTSLGYGVFSDDLIDLGQLISTGPNVFFLHRRRHRPLIERYARPGATVEPSPETSGWPTSLSSPPGKPPPNSKLPHSREP